MVTATRTWLAALALLLIALVGAPAQAQTSSSWSFVPGAVLSPQPAIPWASVSIGSPSVAYDSIRNRFIMIFEAKTPYTDPNCPQGIWALGFATSPNGFSWTVNPAPVLLPNGTSGTYYECVAAHPAAVFVDSVGNGNVQVYFKAEQGADCNPADPESCQYSGIGRLGIRLNAAGNPIGVTVHPLAMTLPGVGGYPRIVSDGGDFFLSLQQYPDIYMSQSSTYSSFPAPTPVITTAAYAPLLPWVEDEFFNPAMVCDDSIAYPFGMFVGGRDTNFANVTSGAMSKAIASNAFLWALSTTTQVEWGSNEEWRHWDVQRLTTGDYLVWFSEKDGNGNNFIRMGGTTLVFNIADVQGKICP